MASGVKCDSNVLDEYHKLSKQKVYRYCIFRLSEDLKTIIFEKAGDKSKTFEDFKNDLPTHDARYATFDFAYTTKDGRSQNKIAFILWCHDDNCKMKSKMLYTSSKNEIVRKLDAASFVKVLEIHGEDELDEDKIIDEFSNNRQK